MVTSAGPVIAYIWEPRNGGRLVLDPREVTIVRASVMTAETKEVIAGCPYPMFPGEPGVHAWLKHHSDGRPRAKWLCLSCGKKRRSKLR